MSSYDFVVLGATGAQGRIVSRDLLEHGYRVLLCGRRRKRIEQLLKHDHKTAFHHVDLTNTAHTAQLLRNSGASVVVNCAEGDFNLNVQKICLRIGAHYLDLGSDVPMTTKQFKLHEAFQRKRLCAITGCGSVPGIGNVMLRYAAEKLDRVSFVRAGFAWAASKPVFIMPFSIISITEEFTEHPTIVENGRFRKVAPQSDAHVETFTDIGKQEIFLVRHPEPYTFYRYLKAKGVKDILFYAGFPEFSYTTIMSFITAGLGSQIPNKDGVKPVEMLAEALKGKTPPRGYTEKENLWVELTGTKNGRRKTIKMSCLAPTLPGWEESGCNIDTGLPCSIMAMMVKEGVITATGSRSPEFFVPVQPFFKALAKRRMRVFENGRQIN